MSFGAHKEFRRDLQRHARRNKDVLGVFAVMHRIVNREALDPTARPHPLGGEWAGYMECHLGGDLLLVWRDDGRTITFARLGTHADIFGE